MREKAKAKEKRETRISVGLALMAILCSYSNRFVYDTKVLFIGNCNTWREYKNNNNNKYNII